MSVGIPVLAYHKVNRAPRPGEPESMTLSPELFEAQVALLARAGYRSVPGDRVAAAMRGSRDGVPERPVLFTFDDGYDDTSREAFPILARHGFTGVVFLIGDHVPGTPAARRPSGAPRAVADAPMMSPASVGRLLDAGWAFGSHGMSHRRLPGLEEAELGWELAASREVVGALTARPVDLLAYPYAAWRPELSRAVEAAGYGAAFTIRTGPVRQGEDPYACRRIPVGPRDTPARLRARLSPLVREAGSRALRVAELGLAAVRRGQRRG